MAPPTSSIPQIDTVDSQKATPIASAARAAWTSARRANIPPSPTGASTTGSASGLAEHPTAASAAGHVAHHHLAQEHVAQVGDVGPQRRLVVGAAVDVVEQLAGQPPTGELAVVARWPAPGPAGGRGTGPSRPTLARSDYGRDGSVDRGDADGPYRRSARCRRTTASATASDDALRHRRDPGIPEPCAAPAFASRRSR